MRSKYRYVHCDGEVLDTKSNRVLDIFHAIDLLNEYVDRVHELEEKLNGDG